MKVINFSDQNSIINQYLAEMRDKDYQQNRLLFRNNIQRVGEMMAYEISKTLDYQQKTVHTPLADAEVSVPVDDVVVATIFRAGLPFHTGFLNVFDHAGNAFVSAYRKYTDEEHTQVGIHIEYLATPDLTGKTLIIADHRRFDGAGLGGSRVERQTQACACGVRHSHAGGCGLYQDPSAGGEHHDMVCRHRPRSQRA